MGDVLGELDMKGTERLVLQKQCRYVKKGKTILFRKASSHTSVGRLESLKNVQQINSSYGVR